MSAPVAFISANGAVRSGLIAKDGRGKGEGERVGPEAGAVGIPGDKATHRNNT